MSSDDVEVRIHKIDQAVPPEYCAECGCDTMSVAVLQGTPDAPVKPYMHRHADYEFIIPHTPIPGLLQDGALRLGQPGRVYALKPRHNHGLAYPLTNAMYTDIIVKVQAIQSISGTAGMETGNRFPPVFVASEPLRKLVRMFFTEGTQPDRSADSEMMMRLLVPPICWELLRPHKVMGDTDEAEDAGFIYESSAERRRPEGEYRNAAIMAAARYITDHYMEPVSIDRVSAQYGMSKYYFTRVFTRVMGEPPYAYLLRARIAQAKIMLQYGNATITQISMQCGFTSSNHFSDLFKKKVCLSPHEYRKIHQERRNSLS